MLAAKRLLQKAAQRDHHLQSNVGDTSLKQSEVEFKIAYHYGIPSAASLLAFDPIQRLLAIATLDGKVKVMGDEGIEALFISPKQLPYKYIEFLQNHGFIVGVSSENEIQVWNLESRSLACCMQWESDITAFSVISGSCFLYIGDVCAMISVLKYDGEANNLLQLPYCMSADSLNEAAGLQSPANQLIVGILPQPCSSGNNVLIAYENGILILWDALKAHILFVGGSKDLQLQDECVDSQNEVDANDPNSALDHFPDKEISSLCWASSNGSILAVGYVDGDIMFWKTPSASNNDSQQKKVSNSNVVKLQLSSAERRLPVIGLHWSTNEISNNVSNGKLFIYGGDEIGAEEVVTVLTLEWSSRMESLTCIGRLDLTLPGLFADMILVPAAGPTGSNYKAALFVLTSPGQLHVCENDSLSVLVSQQERKKSTFGMEFPALIPITDPRLTAAKFISLPIVGSTAKIQSGIASFKKHGCSPAKVNSTKWPLTGGIPSQASLTEDTIIKRMYVAGYHDGSVRLYNATFPALSLIFSLEGQIHDQKVVGFGAPVSKLDFCDSTLTLAVGNDRGLVRVYNLMDSSHEASFPFVTNTNRKVINLRQGEGHYCQAVFSLLDSPIHSMQFAKCGAKLVVGFDSGHVALLDMNALSVLFIIDCQVGSKSPVMSVSWIEVTDSSIPEEHLSHSETRAKEMIFSLTNDSILNIIDGHNGSMINAHPWQPKRKSKAISMYVIEGSTSNSISVDGKHPDESAKDASTNAEPAQKTSLETVSHDSKHHPSSRIALSTETFMDSTILISCEDSLRLYSTKDVVQGKNKTICKVKHANPCCWTSVLSKDGRNCGVVLLFRTGEIHIRSLPGLDLVQKNSLMSILRWNLKSNMEKISTSDNGLIMLANGSELAFISVLSAENLLRIPESLPCLHDKLLAAAADAAFSFSSTPKKKQGIKSGKLNDIVKGFIAGRTNHSGNISCSPGFDFSHLESVFAKPPFSDKPASISENQEAVELNIDDIVIDDDPLPPEANATSQEATKKQTERQRLLGTADSAEPRIRTPTEIRAHYRKAGDASSVAADARNKLMERQEKLERISRRTAELQSGAEDFASMANELVKIMESRNRKWWQL